MEHHADFAVPLSQHVWLETVHERPDGTGKISGQALALGWWVDPPGEPTSLEEAAGTLYLVADESLPHPVWVREGDIRSFRVGDEGLPGR